VLGARVVDVQAVDAEHADADVAVQVGLVVVVVDAVASGGEQRRRAAVARVALRTLRKKKKVGKIFFSYSVTRI
jgi:hypothetical protein